MRLIIFYFIFILFILNRLFFCSPGMIERTMSYFLYPFFKVSSCITYPFEQSKIYFDGVSCLKKKVQLLQQEYDAVQAELIALQSIKNFNEGTKEIQDFAARYDASDKTLAHIATKYFSDKEQVLFIDAGSKDGIKKDDVVVYENSIVGKVLHVFPWYSKVICITDSRCKISAYCQKDSTGICCGKNDDLLDFSFVPHFKPVHIGDLIISSGQGLLYPQGFGIGRIDSIKTDHVAHYIQAKPLIDLQHIEYVYVLSR